MMESQKEELSRQVSSAVRRTEAPRATRTGPPHANRGNPSPTQKARGRNEGTNSSSFTSQLETQHPRALGLKEPNILGVASQQPQSQTQYDKYLIVEGTGGEALSSQSPFVIQKLFNGVESISRLRSGDYLIATKSEQQTKHFLNKTNLGDCLVKVRSHLRLNQIKGVIESEALKCSITKEEIIEDLENYGVTDCYFHQKRLQNGRTENSGRVTLTFKGQKLPDKVTIAGWLHCRVRTYIPNPLRCFKCQLYGHTSKNCKRDQRCSNCGDGDCREQCENPARCVNCGGEHTAFDRNCPRWIEEKEIQKVKAQQNITYKAARNQVVSKRTSDSMSYSAAVQSGPQDSSQQSLAILDVLQAFTKQMEQLQKQIHVLSNKVGVTVEDQEATGEKSQSSKTRNQKRKKSLTRNGASGSSEELTAKRRSVETKGDPMAEADLSDEEMAARLITTKWDVSDDGTVIPRTKESRTVAVKPKNSPQTNSGHPTAATKSAAKAASGENKNAKVPPKKATTATKAAANAASGENKKAKDTSKKGGGNSQKPPPAWKS